ncbi:OLC1v1038485C1 [Oldenlandia corymbosa var. corymbosa]|uniref:OLC1v1038485C1 n=1 Tax=Oldenlandia corymbosa var. corymbosa TaxID=529605 RepID=A0AAV1D108_OLDCO|nr:OLC1v1038485C1 [Oldenlandia corymbosa var. corymbosa]
MASLSPQDNSGSPLLDRPPDVTIATAAASRRLPPPCWSHEETIALIDAYRDKWYSLRRGNLRAVHWQEVADDVAARCPIGTPKTAVQCRHKMEKLRKRYRGEIQRAAPYGGSKSNRYCSAWVHFKRMDAMEKGPNAAAAAEPEEEEEDPEDSHVKRIGDIYKNNTESFLNSNSNRSSFPGGMVNGNSGFRIRIPGIRSVGADSGNLYTKFEDVGAQIPNPSFNPAVNYVPNKISRDGFARKTDMGKRVLGGEGQKGDPVSDVVAAIRVLGDGFVRMEKMKMDMARQVEEMRMEMEIKRTEMILDSQQRIVDAFAKGIAERRFKRLKRVQNSES